MDKKMIFITLGWAVFGSGIGFFAGWKISENKTKHKYEEAMDQEAKSLREYYQSRLALLDKKDSDRASEEDQILDVKVEIPSYGKAFEKSEEPVSPVAEKKVVNPNGKIYIITPEEFGELPDYDAECLSYFEDDILTDEDLNEIANIEGLIGNDALDRFGEYVEDIVYVRNEKIKTDYEIQYEGHPLYADVPDEYDQEEGDYDDE